MRPLLSRAFPDRVSKRANKYGEFKDPNRYPNNGNDSSKKRFGSPKVHDDGSYPLRSTTGSVVGITTNEISSGRLAGPRGADRDGQMEDFYLDELEGQRLDGSRTPRDCINVKKEWRVQHH